ncbi:MAG: acyltransferase [Muribaculaceae bacterium]|nr:acyltransferase [Muribaculaceae bacterium]
MENTITSNEYIKVNGNKFDFLKLVLAVLVAGIHLSHTGFVLRPVFRIAVPLFFMISSYLFFSRQGELQSHQLRKQAFFKFAKRILALYLFWFVVLLPVTIDHRGWCSNVNIFTVIDIVRGFFFGSTFKASWFLMASLIGTFIVWYLAEQKVKDRWIIVLGVLVYVGCCLVSNYYHLCDKIPYFDRLYHKYCFFFTEPYNSFPMAILFVAIGKLMAQNKFQVRQSTLKVAILLLAICLYGEFFMTKHFCLVIKDDCFFLMPPLCLCLFMHLGQSKPHCYSFDTITMRSLSVIIYCCHNSIAYVIARYFRTMGMRIDTGSELFVLFTLTLSISSLIAFAILCVEKRRNLGWLRFSH